MVTFMLGIPLFCIKIISYLDILFSLCTLSNVLIKEVKIIRV